MGGFSADSCSFRGFGHRFAPFQQKSGSFEGVKTIVIALFSRENALFDLRCQTPVFGQEHLRLENPLFFAFWTTTQRP
jgi:hypothetical protein